MVGVRQDITYKVFDQGVISDTEGNVVYNLMQQDAQAMRVVMRVGFAVANPLTRIAAKGSQYPAGFLTPAPPGRRSSDDRQTGQVRHQRRTV